MDEWDQKTERRKVEIDLSEIKKDLHDIKDILNGNGKVGLVAQVSINTEKIESLETHNEERSKEGRDTATFIFRFIITIVLGFIAIKVGLKP